MLASDPFTIVSTALIQTGNTPPDVAFDGTDEWICGFNAYELWLPYCLESRDWSFQTNIIDLTRIGNAAYPRFTDRYAMPADCIHLQTIWRPDLQAQQPIYLGWGMMSGAESIHPPAIEYRIIGGEIETSAPSGLRAKYLTLPSGADRYTATFTAALVAYVSSSILASLNEDVAAAEKTFKFAEGLLQMAASRSDQQENRRVAFRSRMLERRRARWAPWGTTYAIAFCVLGRLLFGQIEPLPSGKDMADVSLRYSEPHGDLTMRRQAFQFSNRLHVVIG